MSPVREPVPNDLIFATDLVRSLRASGVVVHSVRHSIWNGFFNATQKAAWIETDLGIVDVVFFPTKADAQGIRITPADNAAEGRFHYMVQEKPSSAAKLVDASRPLYFTINETQFLVTESRELDKVVKEL